MTFVSIAIILLCRIGCTIIKEKIELIQKEALAAYCKEFLLLLSDTS
jgi:hypothetical protein